MTFSILAVRDSDIGVGVVSGSMDVRSRVPWVKKDVGAIATQGRTRERYGRIGLKMLERGMEPASILEELLREDSMPEKRQVAVMNSSGETAVRSGGALPEEVGSKVGEECMCVGNMLSSEEVIGKMMKGFGFDAPFPLKLFRALKFGADVGGDRRGNRTAALVIKGKYNIDIGIDLSSDPIADLKAELDMLAGKHD